MGVYQANRNTVYCAISYGLNRPYALEVEPIEVSHKKIWAHPVAQNNPIGAGSSEHMIQRKSLKVVHPVAKNDQ